MEIEEIKKLYIEHKEISLFHRYITNNHIAPILEKIAKQVQVETVGKSVLGEQIHGLKIGTGSKRILMWSQMHGNESTTTKAVFDLLNTFIYSKENTKHILESCCIYIIPILNPDGAKAYTRVNANKIDLNRDAQVLSQPESKVLLDVFNSFKPHFCYNLHGQRTIFSAGSKNKPATVSFLAPAQDEACTITDNRKIAMEIIATMNKFLQNEIPEQVGVYDDAFNLNCVGDTFQSKNIPTILFEAGHYFNDYAREETRSYIYYALMSSLDYIAQNDIDGIKYEPYLDIPQNEKLFYDIIIRNTKNGKPFGSNDIGIMYQERLVEEKLEFHPKVEKIADLSSFFGHKEYDAKQNVVLNENGKPLEVDNENVFVIVNNDRIALFLK
ncbi:M14 family zinc carboxypeptidase [uncultured Algibacter sp.]|uniref:M14 family zinc carboxypeptidase n=1 Tax=uncultured Algibacter sp. TaxID=298659 RepID=UPI0026354CF5|nr:M14 family zinc carboxypeptidase [uncultured Algibacter sp.]